MDLLRKIGAIIVMVMAAIGFVLCLAGLFGAWAINEPVTQGITGTISTVDSYLALAESAAQQSKSTVDDLQERVATVEETIAGMSEADKQAASDKIIATLGGGVGPAIAAIQHTLTVLSDGAAALSSTVSAVSRIPGVEIAAPTTQLDTISSRLGTTSENIAALRAAANSTTFDGARVEQLASTSANSLAEVEGLIGEWQSRITTSRSAAMTANQAVPAVVDGVSLATSLLLVLFGAGQASLFVHAWGWFKGN